MRTPSLSDQLVGLDWPLNALEAQQLERWLADPANGARIEALWRSTPGLQFASLTLLPARQAHPGRRLFIEWVFDPFMDQEAAIEALLTIDPDAVAHLLDPLRRQACGAGAPAWLRRALRQQWCRARGGFIGTPDRSLAQMQAEHAWLQSARRQVPVLLAKGPRTAAELAADLRAHLRQNDPDGLSGGPGPTRPWRRQTMVLRVLSWAFTRLAPLALSGLIGGLGALGLLAVLGALLLSGGDLALGLDLIAKNSEALRDALTIQLVSLVLLLLVGELARRRLLTGTTAALILIVLMLLLIVVVASQPQLWWPFGQLALWGVAVLLLLGFALLLLGLIGALSLALPPPYWPGPLLLVPFLLLLSLALAGLHGLILCAGLGAVLGYLTGMFTGALLFKRLARRAPKRALTGMTLTALALGAVGFWLQDQSYRPWPALMKPMSALGLLHGEALGLVLVVLLVLALALLLLLLGLLRATTRLLTAPHLSTPKPEERARFGRVPPGVEAREVHSLKSSNHMVSLTELGGWPLGWIKAWVVLGVLGSLARAVYVDGRLGEVRDILAARWHLLEGGRRLLFISNYVGSFSGYLDDFIQATAQGVNLIWGCTHLPAAQLRPPAPQTLRFPHTAFGIFGGSHNEQAFKSYARASLWPSLSRYAAHPWSTAEINAASQLRDAVAAPPSQVCDDALLRAIDR